MRITTLALSSFLVVCSQAQTTLFSESFEGTPAFTLNTADANSVTGVANTWLVNNVYAGGDGVADCLGLPLDFSIAATPVQPVGITTPGGSYLHTTSLVAIQNSILCCSFGAADGFCTDADDIFSRMNTDVSTVGQGDVSLKFWWLCQGGNQNYGQVFFSINGGTSWLQATTPISNYRNQPNWVEQTITIPEFANQPTLRFGFRFHNGTSLLGAADPGFAVDDVRIIAATAVPNSISTNALSGTAYCQGASLSVAFTAVGAYTAGNIFSAQLSDATGSFASPTVIGTLSSTVSGSITCTIPALTPVGSAYRIRVVSDQPVTVGTANSVDISVTSAPFAGNDDAITLCKNSGIYDLMQFIPGASNCGAWTGPGGGAFSGLFNSSTNNAGAYTYATNCPGGCPQDASTLTIALQDPANAGNDVATSLCENGAAVSLISYVDGGDLTGIFFYNGGTNPPNFSVPGSYDITYVVYGTAPCANDTAEMVFTVNAAPDAGTNATATLCANDPSTALLDLLGGTPDAGGSWTGPGGPFSGIFIPGTSTPGLYTYTVAGTPPCASASASIAVIVDPCSGINEHSNAFGMHWLGQEGSEHVILIAGGTVTYFDLLDAAGRVAARINGPFASGRVRVDLASQAGGFYVLRSGDEHASGLRLLHVR